MRLDDLPYHLSVNGVRLNNLFQLSDGSWKANVRKDDDDLVFDYGKGSTPSVAVNNAIHKIKLGGIPSIKNKSKVVGEPRAKKTGLDIKLEDLEI